jgi:hypothetical protein
VQLKFRSAIDNAQVSSCVRLDKECFLLKSAFSNLNTSTLENPNTSLQLVQVSDQNLLSIEIDKVLIFQFIEDRCDGLS